MTGENFGALGWSLTLGKLSSRNKNLTYKIFTYKAAGNLQISRGKVP